MEIWECKVEDGISEYFECRVEAEFYAKQANDTGLGTRIQPIPLPKDEKAFVAFMQRQFARQRELLLAAHRLADA